MAHPTIGFIGFGEAGSHIAAGLKSAGIASITAYDINPERTMVSSPAELAASADILISAVTASSALQAAQQTIPFLQKRHTYVDLNSVSPGLKQEIDRTIRAAGATFVEAAVMTPVPPYGHRVPMLLGGGGARAFAETMSAFGMRLEVITDEVGSAAAVKMCRSVVVKGLEALLFECVRGASYYGAEDRVFTYLHESFPGIDWKKLADYMVGRVVIHGERRAREMEEVAKTLREAGIDPIMAEATARLQDWGGQLNLRSHFGPTGPQNYREVLENIPHKTNT
jgi:3-hydroxyisobutyrate dehydrogenase-like beta-hydroxyacid dehydrogenase